RFRRHRHSFGGDLGTGRPAWPTATRVSTIRESIAFLPSFCYIRLIYASKEFQQLRPTGAACDRADVRLRYPEIRSAGAEQLLERELWPHLPGTGRTHPTGVGDEAPSETEWQAGSPGVSDYRPWPCRTSGVASPASSAPPDPQRGNPETVSRRKSFLRGKPPGDPTRQRRIA